MTVALLGSECKCNSCQTDTPPARVHRHNRTGVEIIQSPYPEIVQDRYNKFANYIMSYGGKIHGSKFTISINDLFALAVFYEVPVNVTDEIIEKAYDKQ